MYFICKMNPPKEYNGDMRMPTTLKDIAAMAGVTVNTVSHALKDKPDISAATKKRIREIADLLGYRPNLNARGLVLKKTSVIGMAMTESDNPVRLELYAKLRSLAEQDGYHILTVSLKDSVTQEDFLPVSELLDRCVDGLIIGAVWPQAGEYALTDMLRAIRKNGTPCVIFGQPVGELADCVEIDLTESIHRLTAGLIEKGYRDIAFWGNNDDVANVQGYRLAMQEAGLGNCIQFGSFKANRMETAFEQLDDYLNNAGKLPQVILAHNDLAALGYLAALRKHGIAVPEQCAVAGVDNISFGKYSNPSLTSIGFDNGECAKAVWQMLKRRLTGEETRECVKSKVPQSLFFRQST